MIQFRLQLLVLLSSAMVSVACSDRATNARAACKPPLTIGPSSATVAPLAQVVLTASGGRGAYVFDIPNNLSGARISSGAYIAGSKTGVTDTVRVTAAGSSLPSRP